MALGVDGMRAGRVAGKAALLTLGTLVFVVSLTLLYESMRAVMDIGGSCASGGPYAISRPCPKGVGWVVPVSIFGMLIGTGIAFLGVFSEGGPRPYALSWSALFLALGWNFLDYGFDAPGGGASVGWLICGFVFVAMGGLPLILLCKPAIARWLFWGPKREPTGDHLHPYVPPPAPGTVVTAATVDVAAPKPRSQATSLPMPTFVPPAPAAPPEPPSPEPEPEPSSDTDVVEQLSTLADLRERGMLDEDEYEQAKAAVLRREPSS